MIIESATVDDVAKLLAFRGEAANWLRKRGSDQWRRPYPADRLLATIRLEQSSWSATVTKPPPRLP